MNKCEIRKAKQAACFKKWFNKNREKQKLYHQEYYQRNKQKMKEARCMK